MRRFSPALVLCCCTVAVYTTFALAAPRSVRAAGLDFWHIAEDAATLQDALDENDEIEAWGEANRRLHQATMDVAVRLSDGRLGYEEAITAVLALWNTKPGWKEQIQLSYARDPLPMPVTDREVAARYLSTELDGLLHAAEVRGDEKRKQEIAQHHTHFAVK